MMDALSSVAVVDHFVISTEDKVKTVFNRLPEKTNPHGNLNNNLISMCVYPKKFFQAIATCH